MIKENIKKIEKRIKESYLYKLLDAKNTIKKYEEEQGKWEEERKKLIDKNRVLNLQNKRQDKQDKKAADYQKEIDDLIVLLEVANKQKEESMAISDELTAELFNKTLELSKYKIQCEEYEKQIEDYKTEGRYLVKKIKPGRTPNTNKTKISKPMASSVVRYMRNEYQ